MTGFSVSSIRWFHAWTLGLALLLGCGPVAAVSLGDELILSLLGDPVEVEVDVLQWSELDLDRVQVSVGSEQDYRNFGLQWQPALNDLNLNLVGPNQNGQVRVLISSREPLNEPYLELLLAMRWPGGSLLREYILLFDPPPALVNAAPPAVVEPAPAPVTAAPVLMVPAPVEPATEPPTTEALAVVVLPAAADEDPDPTPDLTPDPAPAAAAPVVLTPEPAPAVAAPVVIPTPEPVPAPLVVRESPPLPATGPAPQPDNLLQPVTDFRTTYAIEVQTVQRRQAPRPGTGQTGRRLREVTLEDSLWGIAMEAIPRGTDEQRYQFILALFDLNPQAFLNGNLALLKAGETLQLPAGQDLAGVDVTTAQREFDNRWRIDTQGFAPVEDPLPADPQADVPPPLVAADLPDDSAPVDADQPLPLLLPDSATVVLATGQASVTDPAPVPAAELPEASAEAEQPEQPGQPAVQASEAALSAPAPAVTGTALAPTAPEPRLDQDMETAPLIADTQADLPDDEEAMPLILPADDLQVAGAGQLDIGELIQSKQQRLEDLEDMVVIMRVRLQDAEAVAAQLREALAREKARLEQGGGSSQDSVLLQLLALVLGVSLLVATVLLLRLNAQMKSQGYLQALQPRHAVIRKKRRRQPV